MATLNMEVLSEQFMKDVEINTERTVFLMSCATGEPTPNERLAAKWINELKERIIELEVANQNLHRICGTTAFNPTEC